MSTAFGRAPHVDHVGSSWLWVLYLSLPPGHLYLGASLLLQLHRTKFQPIHSTKLRTLWQVPCLRPYAAKSSSAWKQPLCFSWSMAGRWHSIFHSLLHTEVWPSDHLTGDGVQGAIKHSHRKKSCLHFLVPSLGLKGRVKELSHSAIKNPGDTETTRARKWMTIWWNGATYLLDTRVPRHFSERVKLTCHPL